MLSESKKRGRPGKPAAFHRQKYDITSISPTLKSPPGFHHAWQSNQSLLSLSQQHFSEWLKERRKPREKGSSLPLPSKSSPRIVESDIQILGEKDGSTPCSAAYRAFTLSSVCLSFYSLGFGNLPPGRFPGTTWILE